jgi:hypothetical protein
MYHDSGISESEDAFPQIAISDRREKTFWREPASNALAAQAQVQGLRGLDTASSHLARVAGE